MFTSFVLSVLVLSLLVVEGLCGSLEVVSVSFFLGGLRYVKLLLSLQDHAQVKRTLQDIGALLCENALGCPRGPNRREVVLFPLLSLFLLRPVVRTCAAGGSSPTW